jgi:hypothetical protein
MGKNYVSRYWKTISPEHQGRVYQVGKGYISRFYKTMSPEDQRVYDRWLMGNAIVGSILAMGLVAMAIAGFNSAPSPMVANSKNPDVIASKPRPHDISARSRTKPEAVVNLQVGKAHLDAFALVLLRPRALGAGANRSS